MIGSKKLAAMKKELRQKLRLEKKRVETWVERKEAELSSRESEDRHVLEELRWIRSLLREIVAEKKPRPKRSKKTKPAKEPA
jgi:hypothetical protein